MKQNPTYKLIIIGLFLGLFGCKTTYHGTTLNIDERYKREITFDNIGITIPIKRPGTFIRIDDPVSDMDVYQKELKSELGVFKEERIKHSKTKKHSSAVRRGSVMHLRFADGRECSFIWVLRQCNRLVDICLEHEKYHALCRTCPEGISDLSTAIAKKGFNLDLASYEEELSATIVEILSLHLQGVPLKEISGSVYVVQAVQILLDNKSDKAIASDKK